MEIYNRAIKMDKKVLDFAAKHRVSVLTTILADGKPHSASMHYAASLNPFSFIFLTERDSKKCRHFKEGKKYPASLVVGFSEEEWVQLQMEGEIYFIKGKKELDESWKTYAEKFVGMDKWKDSKEDVLLKFVPKWWKYSEFKPEPPKIISSKD